MPPPSESGSSFVLSNVFAGCPLQVMCAASWKYHNNGQEPLLYIIVGAETGLYVLETSGDRRELVQVSRRRCTWLYVMDAEGIMISVSDVDGRGQVCVHDLNSLLVGPDEDIRFKTTRLLEGNTARVCVCVCVCTCVSVYLCLCVNSVASLPPTLKAQAFTAPAPTICLPPDPPTLQVLQGQSVLLHALRTQGSLSSVWQCLTSSFSCSGMQSC